MPGEQKLIISEGMNIRSFEPKDQADVSRLYTEGLLKGQIAPNDTGADIENIQEAYFEDERHHLWVAVVEEQVIGMIGVASDEKHTAEIRRLRVQKEFQHTNIAVKLLETAISHCHHHGYLKVRLDTCFERDTALDLFDKVGFQHTRTKSMHDKELLEFYLDIYRPPKHEAE